MNKLYISLFLAAVTLFTGCKYDDLQKDVDDLSDRVALLKEQVSLLNENVAVISKILTNEEGTYKLAISKYEYDEKANKYTLTFTDGEVLTLNAGSASTVGLPDISIEDGKWVIDGKTTNVPTTNNVTGADGKLPIFDLLLESTENKYYWVVSTDGGQTFNPVTDENGAMIFVTVDSKLPSDPFFLNVGKSTHGDGYDYFDIQLSSGEQLSVAFVLDLFCEIDNDPKSIECGPGAQVNVIAKLKDCEECLIVPPYGWILKEIVSRGKYEENGIEYDIVWFVVKAPQTKVSRSIETDNLTDCIIMARKGEFWAMDKMQLELY